MQSKKEIKRGLSEIFDPSTTKVKDRDGLLLEIVLSIERKSKYEIPNSATFTMAMDSVRNKGKIFSITNPKRNTEDIPETELMTEGR